MEAIMSAKFPVYKDEFLYLTTTGRKSGQPHEIEIWYVPYAGRYYLCAEGRERANWVQNLIAQPAVTFYVQGQAHTGTARPLDPVIDAATHQAVSALFQAKYQWSDGLVVEVGG
jgi:deazaflavin-dependent oxidoreductase (nitroreductase family)